MGQPYIVCPHCGSHLDHGEHCDCQKQVEVNAAEVPKRAYISMARPLLRAVQKYHGIDPNAVNE